MNTGIQDAHNLAWKVASVLQGIAPLSLVHTYETERKPVLVLLFLPGSYHNFILTLAGYLTFMICCCQIANFNTALSVENFKAAMAVPSALGLDPTIANSGKPMQLLLQTLLLFFFYLFSSLCLVLLINH